MEALACKVDTRSSDNHNHTLDCSRIVLHELLRFDLPWRNRIPASHKANFPLPREIATSPTRDVDTARQGHPGDGIHPPVVNPSCPAGSLLIFLEATYHTTLPCVVCSTPTPRVVAHVVSDSFVSSPLWSYVADISNPSINAGGRTDAMLDDLCCTVTRHDICTTPPSSTLPRSPHGTSSTPVSTTFVRFYSDCKSVRFACVI